MRPFTATILHKDSQNLQANIVSISDMISVGNASSFSPSRRKVYATSFAVVFWWRAIKSAIFVNWSNEHHYRCFTLGFW